MLLKTYYATKCKTGSIHVGRTASIRELEGFIHDTDCICKPGIEMNIFVPFWKIYKEQFKKTAEKKKKKRHKV